MLNIITERNQVTTLCPFLIFLVIKGPCLIKISDPLLTVNSSCLLTVISTVLNYHCCTLNMVESKNGGSNPMFHT